MSNFPATQRDEITVLDIRPISYFNYIKIKVGSLIMLILTCSEHLKLVFL